MQIRLYLIVLLVKFVTFANRESLYTKKITVASSFLKLLFYLRIGTGFYMQKQDRLFPARQSCPYIFNEIFMSHHILHASGIIRSGRDA